MRLRAVCCAVSFSLLSLGAATADTFGPLTGVGGGRVDAPGLYAFNFNLTAPGSGTALWSDITPFYFRNAITHEDYGGGEYFIDHQFSFTDVTSGGFFFKVTGVTVTPCRAGFRPEPCEEVDRNFAVINFSFRDVSEGSYSVTRVADVPEPATWAMMLVGFAGLGASLRRRRGRAAPAA